jgi:hypothetical protein
MLLDEDHTLDHSTEHHIHVVHEREGCPSRDVELCLIRMLQTTTLAHAKQTAHCVLHMERFIFELSLED